MDDIREIEHWELRELEGRLSNVNFLVFHIGLKIFMV